MGWIYILRVCRWCLFLFRIISLIEDCVFFIISRTKTTLPPEGSSKNSMNIKIWEVPYFSDTSLFYFNFIQFHCFLFILFRFIMSRWEEIFMMFWNQSGVHLNMNCYRQFKTKKILTPFFSNSLHVRHSLISRWQSALSTCTFCKTPARHTFFCLLNLLRCFHAVAFRCHIVGQDASRCRENQCHFRVEPHKCEHGDSIETRFFFMSVCTVPVFLVWYCKYSSYKQLFVSFKRKICIFPSVKTCSVLLIFISVQSIQTSSSSLIQIKELLPSPFI